MLDTAPGGTRKKDGRSGGKFECRFVGGWEDRLGEMVKENVKFSDDHS